MRGASATKRLPDRKAPTHRHLEIIVLTPEKAAGDWAALGWAGVCSAASSPPADSDSAGASFVSPPGASAPASPVVASSTASET